MTSLIICWSLPHTLQADALLPPCRHRCLREYQFINATWKGGLTRLLLIVGGSAVWLGEMAVLEGDEV